MSAHFIEGAGGTLRMLTTEMPRDTVFPRRILMPLSTVYSNNFYDGYPNPIEAYHVFAPAVRVMKSLGTFQVRESTCSLLLQPYSNVENRTSVTTAVDYHMPFDIRKLRHGRMRRVMSSLSKRTDMDLVMRNVTPEQFVTKIRPEFRRRLFGEYFPFMKARNLYDSPLVHEVLTFLGLKHLDSGRERYHTKYVVSAITRADSDLPYDGVTRPMLLVTEEGSWDPEGKRPFFDVQFGVMEGRRGIRSFNKLYSVGVKPVFTDGRQDDTRDAPWVMSWNRLVYGKLRGMDELTSDELALLSRANRTAQAYIREGKPFPERRVQIDGVFAQNLGVTEPWYPFTLGRLKRDLFIDLGDEQLKEQTRAIHIDEQITERSVPERMEQFRRAARNHVLYGNALHASPEGAKHLEQYGVAIDAQTIRLIRSSVSPAEFRQALDEMNPDARSDFLDAMLADDLVSMHSVYEFIHTYRTLGLFRYYKLLSQITDAEWDAVVDAMKREKKVGDPTRFQRAQYATLHAHEYELVGGDGSLIVGNDFAQWDLFQRYVNPYALFVRGIRKARVSSRDVRLAISGRNYLENLERLLDP